MNRALHRALTAAGAVSVIAVMTMGAKGCDVSTTTDNSSSDSASSSGTLSGLGSSDAIKDVTITSCGVDDAGFADAKVTVVNNSSKTSDYMIEVAFESKDGSTQIGTGNALVSNLRPGQTSKQDANSLQSASGHNFTCKLSEVQRNESV